MNVISSKAYQIDKQEYDSETQIEITLLHEIEAQAEQDGNRYPAEVEETCPEIHEGTMVLGKVFVRSDRACCCCDAEQGFFCLVQALYIDRIYLIIRYDVHPVVGYRKQNER